jgi:hypothetical protein
MPHPIVGTWALIATEWRRADGRHANPFGPNAVGISSTTPPATWLCTSCAPIAPSPRPTPTPASTPRSPPPSPATSATSAPTTSTTDAGVVTHQVAGAAFPTWAGHDVPRRFRIADNGNRLVLLDSVTASDGVQVEASTTWHRMA